MHPTSIRSNIKLWAARVAQESTASSTRDPVASVSGRVACGKRKPALESRRILPGRKCKRTKTMVEKEPGKDVGHKEERRRAGRPSKQIQTKASGQGRGRGQNTNDDTLISTPAFADDILAGSSMANTRLSSRSASPKKRGKDVNAARPDAGIDMKFLESCHPRVRLRNYEYTCRKGPSPQMVTDLLNRLKNTPNSFIPSQLQTQYDEDVDTPRKSRDPPPQKDYRVDSSWVPEGRLQSLKGMVDWVWKMAARNHQKAVHERQWSGTTVLLLINEILRWAPRQDAVCLNVESCSIEPTQLRVARPNGSVLEDEARSTSKNSNNSAVGGDVTASRMIDLAVGLILDDEADELVTQAFESMMDNDHSLNQSMAYIRDTPLFLDIELKKTVSSRNPEVQLAIWQAASYAKKLRHGWDTTIPMPGIVVSGHEWRYYVTFARDNELVMMGPFYFGTTENINGIYEIAYKLNVLVQWGTTEYKAWFEEHILDWFREKC